MRNQIAESVPELQTATAEARLAKFKKMKTELEQGMEPIIKQLKVLQVKIGRQIYDEKEGRGVLTHKLDEYMNCLNISNDRFEDLLKVDLKYWNDTLVKAR